MRTRWGVVLAVAVLVGATSGRVIGAPTTPVAQSTGTSSSGGGASAGGSSGASGGGDSGSGGGDTGGGGGSGSGDGGSGSDGGGTGDPGPGGGTDGGGGGAPADPDPGAGGAPGGGGDAGVPPQVAPPAEPIPEERVAEGEPTDCGDGARCYAVDDAEGTEGVRVPDGQGGFVVVPIVAVPVVNVDSGASTSAASNVDLQVRVDNSTGDVRIERRVAGSTQLVYVTLAALVGLFVGAAVLGTFLRFRRGPVS